MNVSELLTNLNAQGIQLWVDDDKLRMQSPKGVLTPELKASLVEQKTEILTFLRQKNESAQTTNTGLGLATIGRLIGGYSSNSIQFKSPIIDPKIMAQKLQVTFRPLPTNYHNQAVLEFRTELEQKLKDYGVKIVDWEGATRDFSYEITLPLSNLKKKIKTRVVKPEISAVIDVERPINPIKSAIAEKLYQIYSQLLLKQQKPSTATITKLISWAEDHTMQRLEDPTATQVILLTQIDPSFVDAQIPYQKKIAVGVNTLVKTFSEIVIGVSEDRISILNMNLSDSLFAKQNFDRFVFKSLIPKIYVPIVPLPLGRFQVSPYQPQESNYAQKLVELSQQLATTGLFPSGFQLGKIIRRKSHRDIVDAIVNGRSGVSYGFVAYAEPPQYIGKPEISVSEWENLAAVPGFDFQQIRQNDSGRRYLITQIKGEYFYKQIPNIWLVCSRSGANKTNLNLERDILRLGLNNHKLCLQIPENLDPAEVDIKPSYDTYVMVAIALAAALYTPELVKNGAPMIHFHGYPDRNWFKEREYYAGVDNPSVPCGTYESGVFNFLSIYDVANQSDGDVALAALLEPDHGTNIIAADLDYLLTRLADGLQQEQVELGGKHFASLV